MKDNIRRLRAYMALMHMRTIDSTNRNEWSEIDQKTKRKTFTVRDLQKAKEMGAPLEGMHLQHLVASLPSTYKIEPLSETELKAILEIYNRDVASFIKNFKPDPKSKKAEADQYVEFFDKNAAELGKFYKSKYAVLVGRFPVLSYYTAGPDASDEEVNAALEEALSAIYKKAIEFEKKNLPETVSSWTDLRHLVLRKDSINTALKEDLKACDVLHNVWLTVRNNNEFMAFLTKWRSWGVFGAVTACWVFSGGTLGLPCSIGGAVVSSAFLVGDYVILDQELAELITNIEKADPKKMLDLWVRYKQFKVSTVLHVIGVATLAGFIPFSTTTPLNNFVQELMKNSKEPIGVQILVERLTSRFQNEIEGHIIQKFVDQMTAVEKDLAQDNADSQFYHSTMAKMQKYAAKK